MAIIGDKIVETLYSNKVTSENKRIHTPPPSLQTKLECLLFSTDSFNSGTALHGEGGGGGGRYIFPLLKAVKRQKAPLE